MCMPQPSGHVTYARTPESECCCSCQQSQRLLYINTIQIGYNVFLSFLGNKELPTAEDSRNVTSVGQLEMK
eukprot:COSAG01_NODE_1530_length_9964_cov_5.649879_3_plen_71_part_00